MGASRRQEGGRLDVVVVVVSPAWADEGLRRPTKASRADGASHVGPAADLLYRRAARHIWADFQMLRSRVGSVGSIRSTLGDRIRRSAGLLEIERMATAHRDVLQKKANQGLVER